MSTNGQANRLIHEKSPYLLQHAYNPVDWYPWCEEAFERAKKEDKPVFLSIGYSTCHWCHVMAHESFEETKVAEILNNNFISIKVDKEERPDIDSIYMRVCQTLTGSGGWPTTIFMSHNQEPFFAGTYFPPHSRYGLIGFLDLISNISRQWKENKNELLESAKDITKLLVEEEVTKEDLSEELIEGAVQAFKRSFDEQYGGFGNAPKFPTPHNLMFLLSYYEKTKDTKVLTIVEKTLEQMYRGGIFDHVGYGFSRYSTDKYFLVPHFEKMLYDNALLMMSYIRAYVVTQNPLYQNVAEKTAIYVLSELTSMEGGFFCAQDADSDGVEGKFYVFDYDEILRLLGEENGVKWNQYYGITRVGNFEGKNIPNLLKQTKLEDCFKQFQPQIYEYRKSRTALSLDDKILTSWNSLMIGAFAMLYRVLKKSEYLHAAKGAYQFIEEHLAEKDTLFVSYRQGKSSTPGFLEDYAFYIFALIELYEATLEKVYLERAIELNKIVIKEFYDKKESGFYFYGKGNEKLIAKPKETYDGAIPSGNSVMCYNLFKLAAMTKDSKLEELLGEQMEFMAGHAKHYETGYSFYLSVLLLQLYPTREVTVVLKELEERKDLLGRFGFDTTVILLEEETKEYKLLNGETTFYICENRNCKTPTNSWEEMF